jgi:hypothetical protein
VQHLQTQEATDTTASRCSGCKKGLLAS